MTNRFEFSPNSDVSAFVVNNEMLNALRTSVKLDGVKSELAALFSKVGTNAADVTNEIGKVAPRSIDPTVFAASATATLA